MAGEGVEHKSAYAFGGGLGGRRMSGELLINLYRRSAAPIRNERPWQNFWWGTDFTSSDKTATLADNLRTPRASYLGGI